MKSNTSNKFSDFAFNVFKLIFSILLLARNVLNSRACLRFLKVFL